MICYILHTKVNFILVCDLQSINLFQSLAPTLALMHARAHTLTYTHVWNLDLVGIDVFLL